jgi:hypothetical protein
MTNLRGSVAEKYNSRSGSQWDEPTKGGVFHSVGMLLGGAAGVVFDLALVIPAVIDIAFAIAETPPPIISAFAIAGAYVGKAVGSVVEHVAYGTAYAGAALVDGVVNGSKAIARGVGRAVDFCRGKKPQIGVVEKSADEPNVSLDTVVPIVPIQSIPVLEEEKQKKKTSLDIAVVSPEVRQVRKGWFFSNGNKKPEGDLVLEGTMVSASGSVVKVRPATLAAAAPANSDHPIAVQLPASNPVSASKPGLNLTNVIDAARNSSKDAAKGSKAAMNKIAGMGAVAGAGAAAIASFPLLAVPYIGAPLFALSVAAGAAAGVIVSTVVGSLAIATKVAWNAGSNFVGKLLGKSPERGVTGPDLSPAVAQAPSDTALAVGKDPSAVAAQAPALAAKAVSESEKMKAAMKESSGTIRTLWLSGVTVKPALLGDQLPPPQGPAMAKSNSSTRGGEI